MAMLSKRNKISIVEKPILRQARDILDLIVMDEEYRYQCRLLTGARFETMMREEWKRETRDVVK